MIFVSHNAQSIREANKFVELVRKYSRSIEPQKVFQSSDDSSIANGELWVCRVFDKLKSCSQFAGLIVTADDYDNRWIAFETAYILGRGNVPANIFVFGQLDIRKIPAPLSFFNLIDTGKTGRWQIALDQLGVNWSDSMRNEFAHLFRQCGCNRSPKEPCPHAEI